MSSFGPKPLLSSDSHRTPTHVGRIRRFTLERVYQGDPSPTLTIEGRVDVSVVCKSRRFCPQVNGFSVLYTKNEDRYFGFLLEN